MKLEPGNLPGVWKVAYDPKGDARGSLVKLFDADVFGNLGLNTDWSQTLITKTAQTGTLRGMHWQADPHPETKLITCLKGQIWDCLVDVRPGSATFGQWEAIELNADHPCAVYAPAGFAHGLQTLTDDCEVMYHISTRYYWELQRGFRWDDPAVGIPWPATAACLSPRDETFPNLNELA